MNVGGLPFVRRTHVRRSILTSATILMKEITMPYSKKLFAYNYSISITLKCDGAQVCKMLSPKIGILHRQRLGF